MIALLLALILLPLLPVSLLFNAGLQVMPVWVRVPALLALPVAGALLLGQTTVPPAPLATALRTKKITPSKPEACILRASIIVLVATRPLS